MKYYIAVIEEYEALSEIPWRTERYGLFTSYRDASEFLVSQDLVPFPYIDITETSYDLLFSIGSLEEPESYEGYIEEWTVLG